MKGPLPSAFLAVFLCFLVSGAWGLGNLRITVTGMSVVTV